MLIIRPEGKLPGWKIMAQIITTLTKAGPISEIEDPNELRHLREIMIELRANCIARQMEFFPPKAQIDQIILGLMTVMTTNCAKWPDEVTNFILSHNGNGVESIKAFLANFPDWEVSSYKDDSGEHWQVYNKKLLEKLMRDQCPISMMMAMFSRIESEEDTIH